MRARHALDRSRRRLALGVGVGLLVIGGGAVRWALATREPQDTAPLDIRGKLINPGTNNPVVSSGPPVGTVLGPRPSPATDLIARPASNGTGAIATAAPERPQVSAPLPADRSPVAAASPDGHLIVTFDQLAGFTYEMPDQPLPAGVRSEALAERIPPDIRALDRRKVAVKGYMLPMKLDSGRATDLLLMRDQSMCCFGVVPKINEWLNVKLAKAVKPVMDQPVTISGTLRVGTVVENGYLVCLYALEGETVTTALDE